MAKTKFETKSARVKGLSFHPIRPWILSSLHNGVIQLWDYSNGILVDKFEEHDGPVRGIDFHSSQPLFTSGGDDYKIKVWNYQQKKCLFTLIGHLDYVRTVQFHQECPWILSSSDDQTVRIWNWQNRSTVAILTGHNHYVMCARFHPKDELIVSASLDQTVRIWDFSALKKKYSSGGAGKPRPGEIFGGNDVTVKHVLEGHDRGVNWADFHPKNSNLVISAADDRMIRMWRVSNSRAWEIDSLRGHTNNVSCCVFHPNLDVIVSNGEDRSIRIWDANRRVSLQTARKETERYWILATHPTTNLVASGSDTGLSIFKLEKERISSARKGSSIFYVYEKELRKIELSSSKEVSLAQLNPPGKAVFNNQPSALHYNQYNPTRHLFLIFYEAEDGSYALYDMPKDASSPSTVDPKLGSAKSVAFIAKDRFVMIDKYNKLAVYDLNNSKKRDIDFSRPKLDKVYPAGLGRFLVRCDDEIILYDSNTKSQKEMRFPGLKMAIWNTNYTSLALINKTHIIIVNRDLQQKCSLAHNTKVKSGNWDDSGVFVYSSDRQLFYLLTNGDNGTIKTLENPIYISHLSGSDLHYFTRDGQLKSDPLETTEYRFKQALATYQYNEVMRILSSGKLCGFSIISYLQRKGFPELALHFVQDPKTRFNLAVEAGNIDVAIESAMTLEDNDCYERLAEVALRQGNVRVVEKAYQKTKNFEKLSFLYLITGNYIKLQKMLEIAQSRKDVMSRFHNAMYLGDVRERIKILASADQVPLAYAMSLAHKIDDLAVPLHESMENSHLEMDDPSILIEEAKALVPPKALIITDPHLSADWPIKEIESNTFASVSSNMEKQEEEEEFVDASAEVEDDAEAGGFDMKMKAGDANLAAWPMGDDDLDLPDLDADLPETEESNDQGQVGSAEASIYEGTTAAEHSLVKKGRLSKHAADHVAIGDFEGAMKLLNMQIGVVNFAPLKEIFMKIRMASTMNMPTLPNAKPLDFFVTQTKGGQPSVANVITMKRLESMVQQGYKFFTTGDFEAARNQFVSILHHIPFLQAGNAQEETEGKELINICIEYIMCTRLELQRKEILASNPADVRVLELAAYMTLCNLQPIHRVLTLRSAMITAYKMKNFVTTAHFCRRVFDLQSTAEISPELTKPEQTKKLLAASEKQGKNAHQLDFEPDDARDGVRSYLCAKNFVPVKNKPVLKCPFTGTCYLRDADGEICRNSLITKIGVDTLGLRLSIASDF